jgi:hypothetical protein
MTLLHPKTAPVFTLLALFLVVPGHVISAESTINCHCFQDRTYNPTDPWSTDDYILATGFNSFLARSFGVLKREIVMLKMKEGVGQDDLLVGLEIARATGLDLRRLLGLRRQGLAWTAIIDDQVPDDALKQNRHLEAINTGIPVKEAGGRIADQRIGDFFEVEKATMEQLRKNGLNEKEMTLVLILAHVGNQKPAVLVEQYHTEGRSWSAIAAGLGIKPAAAGKLILQYPARQLPE